MSPSSDENYTLSTSRESQVQIPMRVNISKSVNKTFADSKLNSTVIPTNGSKSRTLVQISRPSKLNNALQMLAKLNEKYKSKPVPQKPSVRSSTSSPSSAIPSIKEVTSPLHKNTSSTIQMSSNENAADIKLEGQSPQKTKHEIADNGDEINYESDFESQSDDDVEETENRDQEHLKDESSIHSSIHTEINASSIAIVDQQNSSIKSLNTNIEESKPIVSDFKNLKDLQQPFQQTILDIEDLIGDEAETSTEHIRALDSNIISPEVRVADWVTSNLSKLDVNQSTSDDEVEIEELLEDEENHLEESVVVIKPSLNNDDNKNTSKIENKTRKGIEDKVDRNKGQRKSIGTLSNLNSDLEFLEPVNSPFIRDGSSLDISVDLNSKSSIENAQTNVNEQFEKSASSKELDRKPRRRKVSSTKSSKNSSEGYVRDSHANGTEERKTAINGKREARILQPRLEALKMSWEFDEATQPSQLFQYDTSQLFKQLSPESLQQVLELHKPMENAINELLKQQIRLTRHFMASQYKMYLNYSDAVKTMAQDYQPTTVQDAKQFTADRWKARS